mmetsp:Transcript_56209/g.137843  ORF Transcript_56209/g.137843 Transcript_56209/m.137843 type:complete len:211 (-) Transcript_56209:565-1197(-)
MVNPAKLFFQTLGSALLIGLIGASFDVQLFLPGCAIGAVAVLLVCGIPDPGESIMDVLKKQTDTNIFKAFISDLIHRIPEYGGEAAAAGLLIDSRDEDEDGVCKKNATLLVSMDIVMCSDQAMAKMKQLRGDMETWRSFMLTHFIEQNISLKELNEMGSVTTLSGRVILLDKLRESRIQILPFEACNGTMYKIGAILVPGKFVKEQSDID